MSIAVPKIRGPLALASASLFLVLSPGVACATPPRPRPVELDPSNPAAAESPTLPVMASLTPRTGPPLAPDEESIQGREPQPKADHDHDPPVGTATPVDTGKAGEAAGPSAEKPGKAAGFLYTCPMHPEVISDKPGRCPKCGMKLVPKEPAPGPK